MAVKRYVLDSYAVLAYLEDSAGADFIEELLHKAIDRQCELFMCVVNYGEVIYIHERKRGLTKAQETIARLAELPVQVIDADSICTLKAAHIKANYPISFADCYAAALAAVKDAVVVTGDPEFACLEEAGIIQVEWLGR